MELFSISCTTCKTRLKVREEGAIGQILACPKCGGMVMVKPPEGWQKGIPLPVAADQSPPGLTAVVEVRRPGDTIGDSQFDAVDELLSDAPPKVRPGTVTVAPDAPGLARPRFAGSPAVHHDTPQKHPGPGDASQKPPSGGRQPPEVSAEPANHHPAAERRATPPGIHAHGKPGNGAPANGSAKSHQTPGGPAALELRAKAEADRASPGEAPPEPPPIAAARPRGYWIMLIGSMAAGSLLAILAVTGVIRVLQNPPRPLAQAGTTSAIANNTGLPRPPKPTGLPSDPAPPKPEVEPVPSPATPSETPAPVAPIPSPAPPVPMTNPPEVAAPTPAAPPATPNPLEPFENILATDTADPFANPDVAAPAVPAVDPAEPVPTDTEPARPALARPAPRVVDVAARLADPLPGIEASGVPLADFLEFIADFSTIPITLEADALPFVRGSSVSPVTVKASGTTIGAALTAGIKPLGLEAVEVDGGLVIRVVEPTPLPMLRYPVADLASGEEPAAELAEALQALVEPGSWTGENAGSVTIDKGELKIVQRRATHLALVVLCEKLRTARKLRYKTSFDPSLFKLDSRSERARPKLETPISLNYSQPTQFVRIVERLEQAAGVRILVDWRDIASAGWNPDGEATLLVDKEPLSQALTKLLEPMDLAWRVVDHQTLQIVTPQTLNNRSELELYKAADLVTADPSGAALLTQVRSTLGDALFRDAGGPFEIRFDEPSGTLLAALPQPKRQELEALLAKLRSGLK